MPPATWRCPVKTNGNPAAPVSGATGVVGRGGRSGLDAEVRSAPTPIRQSPIARLYSYLRHTLARSYCGSTEQRRSPTPPFPSTTRRNRLKHLPKPELNLDKLD